MTPLRSAFVLAALREDLNDAVRGLGAVERCRGRALQDFDALDVIWIQVVRRSVDVPPAKLQQRLVARFVLVHSVARVSTRTPSMYTTGR